MLRVTTNSGLQTARKDVEMEQEGKSVSAVSSRPATRMEVIETESQQMIEDVRKEELEKIASLAARATKLGLAEIATTEEERAVADVLEEIKKKRTEVRTAGREFVRPLEGIVTKLKESVKELMLPLADPENVLKDRVVERYRAKQEMERKRVAAENERLERERKEEEAARKKAEKENAVSLPAPSPAAPVEEKSVVKSTRTSGGGAAQITMTVKWGTTDLKQVPITYLQENRGKINEAVKALVQVDKAKVLEGLIGIPGIRIFEEAGVGVR